MQPAAENGTTETGASQSVASQIAPRTFLDRLLGPVPRALSSHVHIIFLACLGVYLVILPLFGVDVSAKAELIGGNYTNVTSDLGACIAAGMTVHLVKRERRRSSELDASLHQLHQRHDQLHQRLEEVTALLQRPPTAPAPPPAGEEPS